MRQQANNTTLNAPPSVLDETIISSRKLEGPHLSSSLPRPGNLNTSIDAGLEDTVRSELDQFVDKRNHTLLMKIGQDKLQQQHYLVQKRINNLKKENEARHREITECKVDAIHDSELQEVQGAHKRALLLISHLQKSAFEELAQQEFEKEPYTGPLRNLLRPEFHKSIRPSPQRDGSLGKSGRKSQSPTLNRHSSPSPQKSSIVNLDNTPMQNHGETELPKIPEEVSALSEKDKLRLRVEKLEKQLRDRSDYVLSTGERMELVIDYRKYEATKVDQFQELIKKVKLGLRMSNQREVDSLLRERRGLQLEAYRLSKLMQHKIDETVKKEATCLLKSDSK